MALGGINSYGMNYNNYQSIYNDYRLQAALQKNSKYQNSVKPVESVDKVTGSTVSGTSMDFLKEYSATMSDLMGAANSLKSSNTAGVASDMAVTSSDTNVAAVTEKFPVRTAKDISLDVTQLAQAQKNVSDGVESSGQAAGDMRFNISPNQGGSYGIAVSATNDDGSSKTNIDMLKEAAGKINATGAGVRATVEEKDGVASLVLTGKNTGRNSSFAVNGELGAAAGLQDVEQQAQNAEVSVTENGRTTQHSLATNNITLDGFRIGVDLKGTGTAAISSQVDGSKLASAVDDLVKSYNSTLALLNDNVDRGSGVERQLRNMVRGLASEQSLKQIGITTNKDGTLVFDKDKLSENLKKDPKLTLDIVSGNSGVASTAFAKAASGLNTNAVSLVRNDLKQAEEQSLTSGYGYLNMYSRSGAYTMNNYYALGMMFNSMA